MVSESTGGLTRREHLRCRHKLLRRQLLWHERHGRTPQTRCPLLAPKLSDILIMTQSKGLSTSLGSRCEPHVVRPCYSRNRAARCGAKPSLGGTHLEDKTLVVHLTGSNARESNELAAEFQRIAAQHASQVKREKADASSQDLGSTLVLVFGSGAAIALAKGLADWLRSHRKAKLEIRTPAGEVIATGLTSADAVRIVEIVTSTAPPA